MSKKLGAAVNTLLGTDNHSTDNHSTNKVITASAPAEKRAVGRPRGEANDTKATFLVDEQKLQKLRHISFVSGISQKEILGAALDLLINKWEKENGPIEINGEKGKKDAKSLF